MKRNSEIKAMLLLSIALQFGVASASEPLAPYVLPEKNVLPISLESFCSGMPNVKAITTQDIEEELGVFCDNSNAPTAILQQIADRPYDAAADANPDTDPSTYIVTLPQTANVTGNRIQFNIAFAIRVKKSAVSAVIAEEPNALVPYNSPANDRISLKIETSFIEPPENTGNADTSFSVEQTVNVVRDNDIAMKDVSVHRLNMYRIQPNNLDFFVAARTLESTTSTELSLNDEPVPNASGQFEKANVVRGMMTDPADPESALVFTTINIIMNSRDEPESNIYEGMLEAFTLFTNNSLIDAYKAHQ